METTAGTRRRRRGWVVALLALLLLGLAFGLTLAAAPLIGLPGDARAAQQSLARAQTALEDGDLDAARNQVRQAQEHVVDAQERTDGTWRSVLAAVPVVGSSVSDARHLVSALDHATTAAEVGIEAYAPLSGAGEEQLFADGRFDLAVLSQVVTGAEQVGLEADAAERELELVEGDAPFVGARISAARDAAADRIVPLAQGYRRARPVLAAMPQLLGADGEATYLIAMLNPGELRWSGGIPLAFSSVTVADGRADFGETRDLRDIQGRWTQRPVTPVQGNPFHTNVLPRLTFHPDWGVSGREQLEGWNLATGQDLDTIVALDIPAIAEILRATGPVTVPVYGQVTADNLIELQANSYDEIGDQDTRKDLNKLLVAAVTERLLSGNNGAAIVSSMYRSALQRHVAIVSRDSTLDDAFADAGMGGRLTDTPYDYLSAFSMSFGGSKAGYWERRTLTSDVQLAADGSAEVSAAVELVNDAPPYRGPGEDPRRGYFTRWTNVRLLQVLPQGATLTGSDDATLRKPARSLGDRPWVRRGFDLPPNEPVTKTLDYAVPNAAERDGDRLTYRLDYDPQGMVHPQTLTVRLTFPEGYDAAELPDEWSRTTDGAELDAGAVETSERWEIVLERE